MIINRAGTVCFTHKRIFFGTLSVKRIVKYAVNWRIFIYIREYLV